MTSASGEPESSCVVLEEPFQPDGGGSGCSGEEEASLVIVEKGLEAEEQKFGDVVPVGLRENSQGEAAALHPEETTEMLRRL